MIAFEIPGRPFGKQRPRATRQGRIYTPGETVAYERQVGTIAAQHITAPFNGPVRLRILADFQPAASWSKRKRTDALGRPHTQKPDADNVAKAIKDALNRIAWVDDAQVAELIVSKAWAANDRVTVIVEPIRERD